LTSKTIYTSNYARKGTDPNAFGTSVGLPNWYNGKKIKEVAPTWDLVRGFKAGTISESEYMGAYLQLLQVRSVDPHELVDSLPNNAFLLCYESPTDFCHRHILGAWIQFNTNNPVVEWKNEEEQKEADRLAIVDDLIDI